MRLSLRAALPALLSASLLTSCAPPPAPVVVRPEIPAALLSCQPQPEPPSPLRDDAELPERARARLQIIDSQLQQVTTVLRSMLDHARQPYGFADVPLASILDRVREVAARPPAAFGLSAFQMLRYQFWGFALMVFALYARSLVASGSADTLALGIVGGGGFLGGALGLVVAQRWKDTVPPARLLVGSMVALGAGTIVFGFLTSLAGFAALLFCGFAAFFLGKISADTIMQQSMPDDFRGRAFALFDIAYNLGFIIPALVLVAVWADERVRTILVGSGIVFLGLTVFVARWARAIRDQLAPQDDLV